MQAIARRIRGHLPHPDAVHIGGLVVDRQGKLLSTLGLPPDIDVLTGPMQSVYYLSQPGATAIFWSQGSRDYLLHLIQITHFLPITFFTLYLYATCIDIDATREKDGIFTVA